MEGVEDIPGTALHEGIQWEWETFPEYLDALDRREFSMDVAAFLPHAPLRVYVMGDRGVANEDATADDIAEMAGHVRAAIEAGAVGFSSSRSLNHKDLDGEYVPGHVCRGRRADRARAGGRRRGRWAVRGRAAG